MNTARFFDLVLADEGYRCIATLSPADGGKMRQRFVATTDQATQLALAADVDPLQVFFACSNFLTSKSRKGENVVAVRSFWLDLDVGPAKAHATAREAAQALDTFEREVGIPTSLLVRSGVGLHAYWPMNADITPSAWKVTATLLKAAVLRQGLGTDPARTADIASVLRPPGTTHRKGMARPVDVVRWAAQGSLTAFHAALEAYLGVHVESDEILGARPAHIPEALAHSDMGVKVEYPPAFGDRIADECLVMGMIRDTKGKTDQPTWYHSLQLLNRCEDGAELAHEWSKGDPRYTEIEVNKTLARLDKTGPTSCSKFGEYQPALCGACPHAGKVTSPIHLGVAPAAATVVMVAKAADPFGVADKEPLQLPHGYSWRKEPPNCPVNLLCIEGKDDEGNTNYIPISRTLFYATDYLDGQNSRALEIEMQGRDGTPEKRFIVDTSIIGKGSDALATELGKHAIMAENGKGQQMAQYMRSWVNDIKARQAVRPATDHFGWRAGDGGEFVIGDTILEPGGVTSVAVLTGNAATKLDALGVAGSADRWVELIDTAYNVRGQEAFQFLVLAGIASPLFSLFNEFGGITVHAHSDGTGVGKTTAQRAGLSAWGNWEKLQMADGKATLNSLWTLVGTYHNLPVLMDELTNQTNAAASDIVFSVSSGRGKQRLGSDGILKTNNANWSTILMTSGNSLLSDKIAQHRGNAEAELSRLFEFTIRSSSHLSPNEAAALFPQLGNNYGHAGRAFMRYVVDNRQAVIDLLTKVREAINTEGEIQQGERYWSALFACVLTTQLICRKLNLVAFPVAPMKEWLLSHLGHNRFQRESSVSSPVELFGRMMGELWHGVLVTEGAGDLRSVTMSAKILNKPFGPITGRAIMPSMRGKETPKLALSASAIKQWCNKNSVSSSSMFDALVTARFASPDKEKLSLGKGVAEYASVTSPIWCWILDPVRMGVDVSAPSNVHDIQVPIGAKSNGH